MGMSRVALVLLAVVPLVLAGCGGQSFQTPSPTALGGADAGYDTEAPAGLASIVVAARPAADTFILSSHPTDNYGGYDVLSVGSNPPAGEEYRSLIAFNLTALPAGSVINSAVLLLYVDEYWSPDDALWQVSVHRVTSRWQETTATWNTHCTFFAPLPVATKELAPGDVGKMVRFNITPLVRNWVKTPARNFGCMLKTSVLPELRYRVSFGSRDNEAPAFRPRLKVDYTLAP
jgi:hypothetical protein